MRQFGARKGKGLVHSVSSKIFAKCGKLQRHEKVSV